VSSASVASITARLDRIQNSSGRPTNGLAPQGKDGFVNAAAHLYTHSSGARRRRVEKALASASLEQDVTALVKDVLNVAQGAGTPGKARMEEGGEKISFFEALRLRLGGASHLHGLAMESIASTPRLENLLNNHPMVELSMISGAGQPQPFALIVLAEDVRAHLTDPALRERVQTEMQTLLRDTNAVLAEYEEVVPTPSPEEDVVIFYK